MTFSRYKESKFFEIAILLVYIFIFISILPLSIAIILSYFLYPIVAFLHSRLKIPYLIASIFLLVSIGWLIVQFILFIIECCMILIPLFYNFLLTLQLPPIFNGFIDELSTRLNELYQENINSFLKAFLSSMGQIMNIFIFALALIFSLLQSRSNRTWFFSIVLKPYKKKWLRLFNQAAPYIIYFFIVEFIIFSITFSCLICFFYLLEFPHVIHLAFMIALIDVLPMFGLALFFLPLCTIYLLNQHYVLFIFSALFYVFLITTRQLVDSKLWASTLHVKVAHSFFITAASLLLFNVYGLFLAPIFVALLLKLKRQHYF